jgi:tripartite-type tricarboxylate transporter receptor subunit TctC
MCNISACCRSAAVAALLAAFGGMLAAKTAAADEAEAFFAGRQLRIIVGTGAGRGYDIDARLVARHLGNHLPGHPTFVVENMPGASGVRALNYLYAAAPADGSVIATFNNAIPFYQAVGQPGIRFKSERLSWIGSLAQTAAVIAVWHTAGVRNLDDARRVEVVLGATGAGGTKATYPTLINKTLGTRFKVVTGYDGGNAVTLAIERGEVQGDGNSRWSSWKATRPEWVRDKKIIPIVQIGLKRNAELPDVKLLMDYAQNDEQRRMFEFAGAPVALQQPFAGPPGMPPARLAAWRRAFDAMTHDPAFMAEAAKLDLDLDPMRGEEAAAVVSRIIQAPAGIVRQVQDAMTVRASGKSSADDSRKVAR